MTTSFFEIEHRGEHEWFRPLPPTRGPWDPEACHAGPPTAMLARASERAVPEQQLVRIGVDLTRPIPFAGFRIATEVLRGGRTVSTTEMTLIDGDDRPIATARAMHVATERRRRLPTPRPDTPRFADSAAGRFPFDVSTHGQPSFGSTVRVRYPNGEDDSPGPTTLWMRSIRLIDGESASGFQRICPLADCGNAIARNADGIGFVNTDLTLYLHRPPVGVWYGSRAVSRWEPNGIGISDAMLFDERGPVGRAVQTLLIRDVD